MAILRRLAWRDGPRCGPSAGQGAGRGAGQGVGQGAGRGERVQRAEMARCGGELSGSLSTLGAGSQLCGAMGLPAKLPEAAMLLLRHEVLQIVVSTSMTTPMYHKDASPNTLRKSMMHQLDRQL